MQVQSEQGGGDQNRRDGRHRRDRCLARNRDPHLDLHLDLHQGLHLKPRPDSRMASSRTSL